MKQHSKRYMLVLKTWGGQHKATASYDEYDTLEELKEGEKLAKALYKDTPKHSSKEPLSVSFPKPNIELYTHILFKASLIFITTSQKRSI